jgi:hypothetical protein
MLRPIGAVGPRGGCLDRSVRPAGTAAALEIRLVCLRDRFRITDVKIERIFGTNSFVYRALLHATPTLNSIPRGCECAWVLDADICFQRIASINHAKPIAVGQLVYVYSRDNETAAGGPDDPRCQSQAGTAKHSWVANSFRGRRPNRPNDLVVKSDGSIYFTDPWSSPAAPEQRDTPSRMLCLSGIVARTERELNPYFWLARYTPYSCDDVFPGLLSHAALQQFSQRPFSSSTAS